MTSATSGNVFIDNWKYILEALSITLGVLVGGLVGFLVAKIDTQIGILQKITLVRHIYETGNTSVVTLLVSDNQYYMTSLIAETIAAVVLLFLLFTLFWVVKPKNRRFSFHVLTVLMIFAWFVLSFSTLSYASTSARNAIDIPDMNVTQSERLEIDSLVVSLDAFRPFAVYYDYGFRLLLSVFLMYSSSYMSTFFLLDSPKKRQWTHLICSAAAWGAGVTTLFFPFVESRFSYSGPFAIWEGAFNVTEKPLLDLVIVAVIALISIVHLFLLLRICILKKPHRLPKK